MRKSLIEKINFLKDYLSIIILFPATIGGLWQLIELASISPSYIRFFSISQVVPDGLLVLLFVVCIILAFYISRWIFQFTPLSKLESNKWSSTILWMIVIIILFSIPVVFMYLGVIERGYIEVADIFTLIGCLTFILASFSILIPTTVIKNIEKKYINKSEQDNEQLKNKKPKLKNYLFALAVFGILIISLKFFGITTEVVGKIRNDSVNTDRLLNFENLMKELKTRENYKFSEILYLNDKYIFVEYINSDNKRLIEVLKKERLFE